MQARTIRGLQVAGLVLLGCAGTSSHAGYRTPIDAHVATEQKPWSALEAFDGPDEFHFAVVTDRTGEHREGIFESAVPKVNLIQPAFVMSVGDMIEGYTTDEAELDAEWNEFEGFVSGFEMPFFYVPGNHDMGNAVMARKWQERFGPTFYSFRYKDVLFVALNSELFGMAVDPTHRLEGAESQEEQLAFLERTLAENRDVRWTLVFLHQPLWDRKQVPDEWLRVEGMLADRPYTVFAGHHHSYIKHVRNDRRYITLATTGGGSELRGLFHGEFDQVAMVTMTEQGPVIANLLLDGIQDENVRTAALREQVRLMERVLHAHPLVLQGRTFARGTARVDLENVAGVPLRVTGRVAPGSGLRVTPERVDLELAPGAVQSVSFALSAAPPRRFEQLSGATVDWLLVAAGPDGRTIEIPERSALLPESRMVVPRATRGVEVDGDLDEWGLLPIAVDAPAQLDGDGHGGAEDLSFRFAVRQDDEMLYVAVDVVDDSLVFDPGKVLREQDGITVSIDARTDPDRSKNVGFREAIGSGVLRKVLSIFAAPVEPKHDAVLALFTAPLPEGSRVASQRTARGYTAEVAIPVAYLDAQQGGRWSAIRLNVSARDYDEGEQGNTISWWRPDRFGPMAVEGSGTFLRHAP